MLFVVLFFLELRNFNLLPPLIVGTGGQCGATDKQQYPDVFFHTGPF
jgi:hypothetical protein